ncbi:MAG: hypothetical protein HYY37_06455 [Candidatus Aenigmarchaeota archaeon]|nr:hypothetical protein [Candidatus Aenigmarchaeota archaeon]
MDLKAYFDEELRATLVHACAAAIAGFVSFSIGRPEAGFAVGLALLGATTLLAQRVMGIRKDIKWFLGNGIIVYMLVWIIVWTVFHTLRVWSTFM